MSETRGSASTDRTAAGEAAEETTELAIDTEAVSDRVVPESSLLYPDAWEAVQVSEADLHEALRLATLNDAKDGSMYLPVTDIDEESSTITLGEPVFMETMVFGSVTYVALADLVEDPEAASHPSKLDELGEFRKANRDEPVLSTGTISDEEREAFEEHFEELLQEWADGLTEHLNDSLKLQKE